jgi:LAGLIDADG endonuclease
MSLLEVNPVGKPLSEVDRAYLAGFLDGDGAIMALIEKHSERRFGFRVRLEIKATQYHECDVAWLKDHTGFGYIRRNLQTSEWIVRDQQAVKWLLQMIAPYTRCKKNQVALAMEILEHPIRSKEDLIQVARLADALSKFNVRSRNRRKNYAAMIEGSVLP